MLIIGGDDKMIRSTKDMLKSKFDMKGMGLSYVILGIKITRTQNSLELSQTHYVDKILEKFYKGDTSITKTPSDTKRIVLHKVEYSRILDSLMYLMSCTRLDLAYAVSKLSRYTSNASVEYWRSITRLLRYPTVIKGYSDANWISDIKDSRSTSGYVFTLGSATISWKSSKKTIIARSTMESEFIALDKCGEKLREFVEDVPKWPKPVTVICIHCDSQSKIGRAQSTIRNMIRQLISIGVISIDYVKSKDNIVDPLTKMTLRISSWLLMIIGNHLCEREVGSLRRELTGAQFLKAFTEPGSVHDHNEHDYEDMNLLGRVLCEICKLSTQTTDQFKDIESTDS
ncbi:LOW QUALITY PROTEIN: hypothetical protein OSB04_011182 [Centaurea solstitialis]|uniref:Reverse transcriptase Ty1/copia-type domain-containing protein n=1 Tax=Centaurea solstitialis TaxID=347529 RepID=A0AA38TTP8_9ASTR|nr:LOW QUALITY PROTEIN: hypothetical protein OSB04_011182 [Centaurea solstitialis]